MSRAIRLLLLLGLASGPSFGQSRHGRTPVRPASLPAGVAAVSLAPAVPLASSPQSLSLTGSPQAAVAPAPRASAALGGARRGVKHDPPAPAARGLASRLVVSPRNLELPDKPVEPGDRLDEMLEIKDREERAFHLLTTQPLEAFEVQLALERAFPGIPRAEAQRRAPEVPAALKAHLEETLARHPHSSTTRGAATTHEIEDGLAFWVDFAHPADPLRRAAAEVFLHGSARGIFSKDFAHALVADLGQREKALSRLLDAGQLSASDSAALERLARERALFLERHGRYVLVGSGASFHLTRGILLEAERLEDTGLSARLDKVLRFLARAGVGIDHDQHVAAAAFFHPLDNRVAFVMPGRADLNVLSHEGTHARFNRFEEALERWLKAKGYALPYEADGPRNALIGNGGHMSLLNELNSWRLGESFDGGKSDEEILGILRDGYGRQAGAAAAAAFGRLWPVERVKGRGVPALIRESALRLNRLTPREHLALGRRAAAEKDGHAQRDFLRLLLTRRARGRSFLRGLADVARALARDGADEGVRELAERALAKKDGAGGSRKAKRQAMRAFAREAREWVEGLPGAPLVVPWDIGETIAPALYYAHRRGLADYDEVIRRMTEEFGGDEVAPSASEREAFDALKAAAGDGWEAKIRAHIEGFNARGFAALWAELPNNPSYDLRALLAEKHHREFASEHLSQLARWALDAAAKDELRSGAASLLEDVLSAFGVDTLYPESELASLRAMQLAMNRSKGLPDDAHMPSNRSSGGNAALSPTLDEALARGMFDGNPGIHRLKVIELVTKRTYPEELPGLLRRVLEVITDDHATRFDQWVARMFLVPADTIIFRAHQRWGQAVARAVMGDPSPNATALEFVAEFIRTSGGHFGGPTWGKDPEVRLDAAARRAADEAALKLTPELAAEREQVAADLWRLLGHSDAKVAKAALYALAAHPTLVLALEERLAAAMGEEPYRAQAVRLLSMALPGFSPALDAALASAPLSASERELLDLSRPAGS